MAESEFVILLALSEIEKYESSGFAKYFCGRLRISKFYFATIEQCEKLQRPVPLALAVLAPCAYV